MEKVNKNNKIWYLSTCSTCKRIISELNINKMNFEMIDIKNNPISKNDLDMIKENSNYSYEELFNKRAIKYQKSNLKNKLKDYIDFKNAILNEYTFLKRPIIKIGDNFFIGNSKKVVEEARKKLNEFKK